MSTVADPLRAQLLVVGAGPGGYVAAIRAGQLGLDTVLVEADRHGGTCLVRGCIPSKALIHAAARFDAMREAVGGDPMGLSLDQPPQLDLARTIAWKDGIVDRLSGGVGSLLARAGVRSVRGWATFTDARTCSVQTPEGALSISAEHVVLACGSEPASLPGLAFGGPVLGSSEVLSLQTLPEKVVVVGAGYIGLELGTALRRLGSEVAVVESGPRILPAFDEPLTVPVRRWLEGAGVELHLGARALGLSDAPGRASLRVQTAAGEMVELAADVVLSAVGRRPRTSGWGLERMGIDMEGGFVRVDDQCRTSMRNVWAIGDLVGEPMLAHKASAQGEMVAEIIAGRRRRFDPAAIPAVCFTEPEIVSVGLLPHQAAGAGVDCITGQFPFAASGRALSMGAGGDGGFVRVVARRDTHRVLGVQAVGAHVSELGGEFVHAIEMGAVLEDVAGTIHAHPSLGEAFGEAALRGLGHAIHV